MARFVPVKTKFVSYIENDLSKSEQNDKFHSFLPRDLVHTHTDVISTYIGWSDALANLILLELLDAYSIVTRPPANLIKKLKEAILVWSGKGWDSNLSLYSGMTLDDESAVGETLGGIAQFLEEQGTLDAFASTLLNFFAIFLPANVSFDSLLLFFCQQLFFCLFFSLYFAYSFAILLPFFCFSGFALLSALLSLFIWE